MRDFIFSTAISEILNHYLILSLDRSVSTVRLIQAKPSVSQASSGNICETKSNEDITEIFRGPHTARHSNKNNHWCCPFWKKTLNGIGAVDVQGRARFLGKRWTNLRKAYIRQREKTRSRSALF